MRKEQEEHAAPGAPSSSTARKSPAGASGIVGRGQLTPPQLEGARDGIQPPPRHPQGNEGVSVCVAARAAPAGSRGRSPAAESGKQPTGGNLGYLKNPEPTARKRALDMGERCGRYMVVMGGPSRFLRKAAAKQGVGGGRAGSMYTHRHRPGHLSSNLVGPMPRRCWGLGDKSICGNACKRTRKIPLVRGGLDHLSAHGVVAKGR